MSVTPDQGIGSRRQSAAARAFIAIAWRGGAGRAVLVGTVAKPTDRRHERQM